MPKYRIVIRKTIDGVETVEDLGLFEAFTSNKARAMAVARNATRFGFKQRRGGEWFLNGWSLRRTLHRWNGLCPAGKHGLDFEGQTCDLCAISK